MSENTKKCQNLHCKIVSCEKLAGLGINVVDISGMEEVTAKGVGTLRFVNFNRTYCIEKANCQEDCFGELSLVYDKMLKEYKIKK